MSAVPSCRINPETGLREEVPAQEIKDPTISTEPINLSSPKQEFKSLVRYMYTFKDSPKYPNGVPMSGERITFEDSPITLFLHPNNQYWIKRGDTLIMKALGKARQFCNEMGWDGLRNKLSDAQRYVQEKGKKSSPILSNLYSKRVSTFDIEVLMDKEGSYIQLGGRKGTPYGSLCRSHIPRQCF